MSRAKEIIKRFNEVQDLPSFLKSLEKATGAKVISQDGNTVVIQTTPNDSSSLVDMNLKGRAKRIKTLFRQGEKRKEQYIFN